jgi:hypothetical protein
MTSMVKGSAMLFAREQAKKRGPEFTQTLLNRLNEEEKKVFESALAFSWIPISVATCIWEKAAQALFPGERSSSLRQFGKASMLCNISGVYKVAMKITSISFAMEQVARVWSTLNNTGEAKCVKNTGNPKELEFIVNNYPDMPDAYKQTLAGSTEAVLETAGAKNVRVTYKSDNATTHHWIAMWS